MIKPAVYHFFLDARVGGPHNYALSTIDELKNEFDHYFYASGHGNLKSRVLFNFRSIWRPLYFFEVFFNVFIVILDFRRSVVRVRNSVFVVHGAASLAPIIAARILKMPVLWIIHETTPSYRHFVRLGVFFLGKCRFEIALVANKSALVYGVESYVYLPAGVNRKFWSRSIVTSAEMVGCDWMQPADNGRSIFKIVTVANLNPLKGIDLIIDALSTINFGFNLKIVGSELKTQQPYARLLSEKSEAICAKNGNRRVDFLGRKGSKDIRALLASCDLFVLPSRSEACPIALLEAIAMGCFIVAADVGDVANMLADYPRSIIFQPGSVAGLIEAIEQAGSRMHCTETISRSSNDSDPWQLSFLVEQTALSYRRLLAQA